MFEYDFCFHKLTKIYLFELRLLMIGKYKVLFENLLKTEYLTNLKTNIKNVYQ